MPRPKSLEPKYRRHKSSGCAYVSIDGKDVWLGQFGSKESKNKYHAVLAEWIARDRASIPTPLPDVPTSVAMMIAQFRRHAASYYVNADGSTARELDNHYQAMRVLKAMYGDHAAAEFSPLKLKAVRVRMLEPQGQRPGWSRNYTNRQIGRIKAIFKWAVENEIVPPAVYQGLLAVGGLRKGRTEARETDPVKPAPDDQIEAVRLLVSPSVQAMIDLQLLTGARPGELCIMRSADIDTSSDVWVYRPAAHKTAHHGHRREIYIGPKARKIIEPLLKPDVQAFIFSPAESERARNAKRSDARESDETPSQAKRRHDAKRRRRSRAPGDRYDVAAYRRAIARAAAKAYPPPAPLARLKGESLKAWRERLTPEQRQQLRQWVRGHCWHPHRLRHNAATRLRKEFGIEAASVILGHATITVTQVYAEKNVAAARRIMGEVG